MNASAYANRATARRAPLPRNMRAVGRAHAESIPLVISFVGYAPWSNPTVFCDSGQRYAWAFTKGLLTIVAVKPGVQTKDALPAILGQADVIAQGYPVLVDVELREAACVAEGDPVSLWQIRRGTELWRQYFAPQT